MKRPAFLSLLLAIIGFLLAILLPSTGQTPPAQLTGAEQALAAFSAMQPIDVHAHVFKSDPGFQLMLERLHLKLLNILVMDDTLPYRKQLEPQVEDSLALVRSSKGHIAWCTTFDPYRFSDPSFANDAIQQIDRDFAHGAVAVKIWKNIGMEIKDRNGKFIMADDPKFEPIYRDIARQGKTLMMHLAEPNVAWGPPDPSDPSWSYYKENPQWYHYNEAGFPSKQEILRARDHVLAENPELRVVGVHLGSMEKDLDAIAEHFDRYPNFAIDTAARMDYLMLAPREKVRSFFLNYQDRILYGTDLDLLATANVKESLEEWQSTYVRDWKFLATGETFDYSGKTIYGLNLPEPVLQKIFRANAMRWIPGL
jgi:predicted TIM-barrel fold metal-dependent hydrolase